MKKTSETVVFFGSGPVAAESLRLLSDNFDIEAVITKPKPQHHRGAFPVIDVARSLDLKIYEAADAESTNEIFRGNRFDSRVGVIIDHGLIVDQEVIDAFELGIINSHFSLLPRWRGADPITYSILKGDSTTGVSLMLIVPALDEGDLIAQEELKIDDNDTTVSLTPKLINLSDQMLSKHLPAYLNGEITPWRQQGVASYSTKIHKQDGVLDFNKTASELALEVRAYAGWPKSRTTIADKNVVVTAAHAISGNGKAGDLVVTKNSLGVQTSDGILVLDMLIPAGKKAMTVQAFLAGYKI